MESFINVMQSTYRLFECFVMAYRWANGMNKNTHVFAMSKEYVVCVCEHNHQCLSVGSCARDDRIRGFPATRLRTREFVVRTFLNTLEAAGIKLLRNWKCLSKKECSLESPQNRSLTPSPLSFFSCLALFYWNLFRWKGQCVLWKHSYRTWFYLTNYSFIILHKVWAVWSEEPSFLQYLCEIHITLFYIFADSRLWRGVQSRSKTPKFRWCNLSVAGTLIIVWKHCVSFKSSRQYSTASLQTDSKNLAMQCLTTPKIHMHNFPVHRWGTQDTHIWWVPVELFNARRLRFLFLYHARLLQTCAIDGM